MELQILDISDDDHNFEYTVTLYGKRYINDSKKSENIVCHVKGFKPSFYIRVPNETQQNVITVIMPYSNLCILAFIYA